MRDEQSRRTRARIVDAARELLLADGYAGTTMAGIAAAAEVSTQTVYNAFTSKATLVKAVWDITLVGDDEPIPLAERPDIRATRAESDPRRFLAGYAALGGRLLERLAPLMSVLAAGAAAGDVDLAELMEVLDEERLVGTLMTARRIEELEALRDGLDVHRARDMIWALNSVQLYELLVTRRGWSIEEYVYWVGQAMADAVVEPGA